MKMSDRCKVIAIVNQKGAVVKPQLELRNELIQKLKSMGY